MKNKLLYILALSVLLGGCKKEDLLPKDDTQSGDRWRVIRTIDSHSEESIYTYRATGAIESSLHRTGESTFFIVEYECRYHDMITKRTAEHNGKMVTYSYTYDDQDRILGVQFYRIEDGDTISQYRDEFEWVELLGTTHVIETYHNSESTNDGNTTNYTIINGDVTEMDEVARPPATGWLAYDGLSQFNLAPIYDRHMLEPKQEAYGENKREVLEGEGNRPTVVRYTRTAEDENYENVITIEWKNFR